jgi:uncharacterized protein
MTLYQFPHGAAFHAVEAQLQRRIQQEEAAYRNQRLPQGHGQPENRFDKGLSDPIDSLWSHSIRVAAIAETIGRREGFDPTLCRLAGLFHDAGKFVNGAYHAGQTKEEDGSVRILYELTRGRDIRPEIVEQVATAILQLYSDGPDGSEGSDRPLLARILFDADNLDKLGLSGVANFWIKAGLRGRGLNRALLYRIGVELTYARYAPRIMKTAAGGKLAAEKAPETIDFYHRLLHSLGTDGLFDFRVNQVDYRGMTLDIVAPSTCACGARMQRRIWDDPALKCRKIHVEHRCERCGDSHELQFCQPLLSSK